MARKPRSTDKRSSGDPAGLYAFLLDVLRIWRGSLTAKVIFLLISSGIGLLTTPWWLPFIQTFLCEVWLQDCPRIDQSDRLLFWTGLGLNVSGILLLLYYYPRQSQRQVQELLQSDETTGRTKVEKDFIKEVAAEVSGRLNQSLNKDVFISLGKTMQYKQVERLWDNHIKVNTKVDEKLPADVTILDIFDRPDINGRFLILGKPGAGKTTEILDLAKGLLKRTNDPKEPIPVLLDLSSWGNEEQTIPEWIVKELSKRGLRADIGQNWLDGQKLLPLLDGLDEVRSDRQNACVEALNEWITGDIERSTPLVVCSRIEEYEQLETQLQMNGAICLSELSDTQIKEYLDLVERPHLKAVVNQNPVIRDLVQAPFFLDIMLFVDEPALRELRTLRNKDEVQICILNAYISKGLERIKHYSRKQMRSWLVWIAQQLEREQQTEFLVEKIQPHWLLYDSRSDNSAYGDERISSIALAQILEKKQQKRIVPSHWLLYEKMYHLYQLIYNLVIGLGFLLLSLLLLLSFMLSIGLVSGFSDGWIVATLLLLFIGFLLACVESFGFMKSFTPRRTLVIQPIEKISLSWANATIELINLGGLLYLAVGCFFGLFAWILLLFVNKSVFELNRGLLIQIFGLVGILIFMLGVVLDRGLEEYEFVQKQYINQGIWKSLQIGALRLVGIPIIMLLCGLIFGLIGGLIIGLIGGLIFGVFGIMIFCSSNRGVDESFKHFVLRQILWANGLAPWNYAKFLTECSDCLLLQRIGGRFRFMHKTVQEHFAAMPFERP